MKKLKKVFLAIAVITSIGIFLVVELMTLKVSLQVIHIHAIFMTIVETNLWLQKETK